MTEDGVVYWPCDPPDDAVMLLRVVGTTNISKVRRALDEAEIPYTMGGRRKDDVNFYVPAARRDEAEREIRARTW